MKTILLTILAIAFFHFSFAQFENTRSLIEVNTVDQADAYPWISHDGNRIYFTQESAEGNDQIVMASRQEGQMEYGNIRVLDFNLPHADNMSGWFSKDETEVYFSVRLRDTISQTATSIYFAKRNHVESAFSEPQKVTLRGNLKGFLSAPSLTPDLSQLFLYNNGGNKRSILIFEKNDELDFDLESTISFPEDFDPKPGQLSKDGLKQVIKINYIFLAGSFFVTLRQRTTSLSYG